MNERIKMVAAGMVTLMAVGMIGLYGAVLEEQAKAPQPDEDVREAVFITSAIHLTLAESQPIKAADKPAAQQRNGSSADLAGDARPAWTTVRCRIVHYCECQTCCGKHEGDPAYGITATGTRVTEGRTVAVDPSVIPLGSEVMINGHSYVAEDTGVHGETVDIYVPDHEQAIQMGTYETIVMWR